MWIESGCSIFATQDRFFFWLLACNVFLLWLISDIFSEFSLISSFDKCTFEGIEITKTQKAQGIVEFALVLPLFLLLVMGVIYFGMAFSDYLTMSNSVRSIAHDASLRQTEADYRNVVINNTRNLSFANDVFIWQPDTKDGQNNKYLSVEFENSSRNVVVTAHADFNKKSAIANAFNNLMGKKIGNGINIRYSMYSDVRK